MVLLWSSWILRTIGPHKLAYQFEEQTALNRLYTVGMLFTYLIDKILIACAVAFQNSSRVFKVCYYLKSWAAIHLLQQHQWASAAKIISFVLIWVLFNLPTIDMLLYTIASDSTFLIELSYCLRNSCTLK